MKSLHLSSYITIHWNSVKTILTLQVKTFKLKVEGKIVFPLRSNYYCQIYQGHRHLFYIFFMDNKKTLMYLKAKLIELLWKSVFFFFYLSSF